MDLREMPVGSQARHPWELERATFFAQLVRKHAPGPLRVLDVGSGDGYVARRLLETLPGGSSVMCFDANYNEAHLREFRSSASAGLHFTPTLPEARFDLVMMLDVIEHVPDDRAFLLQIATQCLRSAGHVLVSVPAHPALYTRHDVALGHYRRYTPSSLRAVLLSVGVEPLEAGSLFGCLIAPRALEKLGELARGIHSTPNASDAAAHFESGLSVWHGGPVSTALVQYALRFDIALARRAARLNISLPGLSVWAFAGASSRAEAVG